MNDIGWMVVASAAILVAILCERVVNWIGVVSMKEKVLDLTAGGFPERTFVGKNTTVADVAARVAELEAENAKLRACVEAYIVPVAALVLDAGNRKLFAPEVWDALVAADVAARAEVDKP